MCCASGFLSTYAEKHLKQKKKRRLLLLLLFSIICITLTVTIIKKEGSNGKKVQQIDFKNGIK